MKTIQLLLLHLFTLPAVAQCCVDGMGTELVFNGDFSNGTGGFTTSYTYSLKAAPGAYGIVTNGNQANSPWAQCKDHTTGNGYFMWVDASANSNINVWTQQITGLQPYTNYIFSCWINNLGNAPPATLQFSINNTLIGSSFTAPTTTCNWQRFYCRWNSGSQTSATITITNQSVFGYGNDVGIDDISFKQCFPPLSKIPATICNNASYKLPSGKTITTAGIYNDTIKNMQGCDSVVMVTLSALPPIIDSVAAKQPVCAGEGKGEVTITATGGTKPYLFDINTLGSNASGNFANLNPGKYSYTITDNAGCKTSGDFEILSVPPFIFITASPPDTIVDPGSPVKLMAICNAVSATFSWQPATYLSCNTCPNPTAIPAGDMVYTITAAVPLGTDTCRADTTIRIRMMPDLWIPNVFSPNGDFINDFFAPAAVGLKELELVIFNSYGEQIFQCSGVGCQWDGTYKNRPCAIGVYAYLLRVKTNLEVKINKAGNVTLLR